MKGPHAFAVTNVPTIYRSSSACLHVTQLISSSVVMSATARSMSIVGLILISLFVVSLVAHDR